MVRIKHRYLLISILYPSASTPKASDALPQGLAFHAPSLPHLTPGLLISHLRNTIALHFGDCGSGLTTASLKVVYFSPVTSTAIIRCSRQYCHIVWAALTFTTEMPAARRGEPGRKCVVQVVRVSGTIRKSEEELLRRARAHVVRAKMINEGQQASILDHLSTGHEISGTSSHQQHGVFDDDASMPDSNDGGHLSYDSG